jgi:16S rRNA (cytosine1402-N4)-methyltransferase
MRGDSRSSCTMDLSVVASPPYLPAGGLPAPAVLRPEAEELGQVEMKVPKRPPTTPAFAHEPAMVEEVVAALANTPQGILVDATVGGGGHAAALLSASTSHRLIGIDRDLEAVAAATERLSPFGARARIVHGRFDEIAEVLANVAPDEPVSGVLFDLGVSSLQLDKAERGFSYRFDAPLDMRMDPSQGLTAADVVNGFSEEELARLLAANGETRFARRIAHAMTSRRPLLTTSQLSEVVRDAVPAAARSRGGHPAKRVFQAIRIVVNEELIQLPAALESALSALTPGGRVAVLSYHSGEDRITKRAFADAGSGWCTCPRDLPCVCGAVPAVAVLTRGASMPRASEIAGNPRSSSARLRIAERLDTPWRSNAGIEKAEDH